jgi:hypothetical protein
MLIRSDMSGMRVLAGLRASVESFPMWWAFPTSESYARYDSPTAYGGRSRCQDFSAALARDASRRVGSSMVPSPGFPFRASRAVDHSPTFSTAGAAGVSQVLRRFSSCMPRPEDSGGPSHPCQDGWSCVAFGVRSNPRRPPQAPLRSCTSPSGCAVPPAAPRIRCRRFAPLVHRAFPHASAMDARRDTGEGRALPRQGLAPCQRRQAYLGAITLGLSRADSRSDVGAEAVGSRLQADVGRCARPLHSHRQTGTSCVGRSNHSAIEFNLLPNTHAAKRDISMSSGCPGRIYEFGDRAKPNKASKRPLTQASLRGKR